jgi:hypothetical protein
MGPNTSYDDPLVFFASYIELFASCDADTTPYRDSIVAFPPRLCHAPTVIAVLVPHSHLPMMDDMEYVDMVDDSGDLIFDALCMDSDLGPFRSEDE